MAAQGKSWTKSLFVGLWTLLNFCRKLVFNIIFILIIIGVFAVIGSSSKEQVEVTNNSALVLNLKGTLVIEKQGVDPVEKFFQEAMNEEQDNPEVLVRDVVKAIENAKEDNRIKALILDLQGFAGGGLNKMNEVAEALDDFKTSEKPIYALGDYYSQNQYYLAAHADHVYLNPMGGFMLEGYGSFPMYYKRLLDKLKVTTHIFRVGTYKSAVEPYMRNDMSDAAKASNQEWLDAYWHEYKVAVAKARQMDINNFDEKLDDLLEKFEKSGNDYATYALQYGWVDALKTREDIREEMVALVGSDDNKVGFKITTFNNYMKVINPPIPKPDNDKDKIAIVVAKGTILDGNQKAGTIGGESTARLLRAARLDDTVKAVVLEVDSPGGSSFASEIIRQEVLELKAAGKPIVTSMNTYAASGGYWISANTDKIIATPTTITGSIGVFGMFYTFENSLDYIGVNTDGVGTTDMAGFNVTKALDPRFATLIQRSVEKSYNRFITMVADARGLDVDAVDKIAQGHVWIGAKAKELGLVDELGNLDTAISAAAELANLDDYETRYVTRKLSPKELFWKEFFGKALVLGAKLQFSGSNSPLLGMIKSVVGNFNQMQQMNDPQHVYVYCLPCQATSL
jgi:protease-4